MWARVLALGLCALLAHPAGAEALDPRFRETRWAFTETLLDGMAWAPDGSRRLFTIHKNGAVRITRLEADGSATLLPTPFATIEPLHLYSECGLIGMAFDPDFASNGYVYFFATVSPTEQQILRYTAVGDLGTERHVVVAGLPTTGKNHDGGALGIGPDGKLYWAIGDIAQGIGVNNEITTMGCKVGRVNRDGSIPADNPFVDGAGPNDDRIWARGFRNPFTMTFQPSSGKLWLNVVGTTYEQIFVVGRGDHGGWMWHENDQPDGFIKPVIKYRTRGPEQFTLATLGEGAVRAGGVVTFRTTARHGLRKGEKVTVSAVSDPSFNGSFFVASASDDPQAVFFTVRQPGPDASSGNGVVDTLAQGSVVTGGTFYDATGFPAEYRGNFFYTDFGSGRVMRAVLAPDDSVAAVDWWATAPTALDAAVGPDGALYVGSLSGTVMRYDLAPGAATGQAIVVSRKLVDFGEGMDAVFDVSLASAPSGDVVVTVGHSAGSSGISVVSGQTLRFTVANAGTPQPVRLHAVADADQRSEQAVFTLALSGTLVRETVTARVLDAAGPSFGDGGLLEDDAGVGDAGIAGDGVLAEDAAGCGCHTGREPRSTGLALLLVLLGGCGVVARQRARARRPR